MLFVSPNYLQPCQACAYYPCTIFTYLFVNGYIKLMYVEKYVPLIKKKATLSLSVCLSLAYTMGSTLLIP